MLDKILDGVMILMSLIMAITGLMLNKKEVILYAICMILFLIYFNI